MLFLLAFALLLVAAWALREPAESPPPMPSAPMPVSKPPVLRPEKPEPTLAESRALYLAALTRMGELVAEAEKTPSDGDFDSKPHAACMRRFVGKAAAARDAAIAPVRDLPAETPGFLEFQDAAFEVIECINCDGDWRESCPRARKSLAKARAAVSK